MPPLAPHGARFRGFPTGRGGFTLVEVAVVALIVGLLAVIAVPTARRYRQQAMYTVVRNDLRVLSAAFQQHAEERGGRWPPDQNRNSAAMPAGMDGYLRTTNWGKPTPFGGAYNWDYNVRHRGRLIKAAITIYPQPPRQPLTVTQAQLLDFDRRFDDGNLDTGSFLLGISNAPVFVIEP
ncbi:MAG TPA: type II secretion system protein [Opitutaceae bacterium]|nr:type II secretion system protein [Opitutaceae bacterium]